MCGQSQSSHTCHRTSKQIETHFDFLNGPVANATICALELAVVRQQSVHNNYGVMASSSPFHRTVTRFTMAKFFSDENYISLRFCKSFRLQSVYL